MNKELHRISPLHLLKSKQLFNLIIVTFLLVLAGCSSTTGTESDNETDQEQDQEEVSVSEKDAVDAIIATIRDSGYSFPSREPSSKSNSENNEMFAMDYIGLDSSENGLIQIRLWIDKEGNIIPNPSWQSSNENVCKERGRYMKGAVKLLEFTILTPSREVQLNVIDIESGKIDESVIGTEDESDNDDADWLNESMKDAWEQMQGNISIGGAVGPCGDVIGLTIEFNSEITTDLTSNPEEPVVYFEHIEASFPLELNDDNNVYTGTGDLEWVAWEFNGRQSDNAPEGKRLEVVRLITPGLDHADYDNPALELELPGFEDGTPLINISWPLIHTYKRNEEGDNYTYIITDWNVNTEDQSTVMTRSYDRTENFDIDGDPVQVTEKTVIVISRN